MNFSKSYKNAFFMAIGLHLAMAILLIVEPYTNMPVFESEKAPPNSASLSNDFKKEPQAIQAVSIDSQEVEKKIEEIKQQQMRQKQAEMLHQKQLADQAEHARQQRIAEQKHLEQLKQEAEKIAIARKKEIAEEKRRLQELAEKKKAEEQKLAQMKKKQEELKKQQIELERVAALKKKQDNEKAQIEAQKLAKTKEEQLKKQQAAARQAAINAERDALIAGEIDRYKALIISAISRQWILPENVDNHLSSQFRIRLAPNGSVLEVNLTKSSGDSILDRSAQAAIYKASPLPVPSDPTTFNLFRDITLTVRPEHARG